MNHDELMANVKNKLASKPAITANWIQQRYHVLQMQARKCIQDLQEQGLIGQEWSTRLGGYPVIQAESLSQASEAIGQK